MASRRFRSQPALQRTGSPSRSAVIGLLVLAGIGLGVGALIGTVIRGPPPQAESTYAAGPIDEPATIAPPKAEAPSPPAPVAPTTEPPAAPHPKAKAAPSARPSHAVRPPHVAAPPAAVEEETWAQRQQAYEKARAAYDADERAAGYRWAQQNRIRLQRYCRVAAQRTPAFMEGCLNYLKPREPSAPQPADTG